jgi:Family of unknown function (DUF6977)
MAERPIFVPHPESEELVKEVFLQLVWSPGFALVQKEKNIEALHKAAEAAGYHNILEVSTKSQYKRGQHLSAFHLKVRTKLLGDIPLESAFQGSKVFENGGPFVNLYEMEARDAKKNPRLRESGKLIGFQFEGMDWPLEPKTAFYDWLYTGSLYTHRDWIKKLSFHAGFSDIEFNPYRSINCQARSIALFLSLMKRKELDDAIKSPASFLKVLQNSSYRPQLRSDDFASRELFAQHA